MPLQLLDVASLHNHFPLKIFQQLTVRLALLLQPDMLGVPFASVKPSPGFLKKSRKSTNKNNKFKNEQN